MLVRTQQLDHGTNIPGIYDVSIDPVTKRFRGVTALSFPHRIYAFDYDTARQNFLLVYSKSAAHVEVITATASGGELTTTNSLVDSTWAPFGARFANDGQRAIVYSFTPTTQVPGFYSFSLTDGSNDSLLVADNLDLEGALGFDVGPTNIYYGRTQEPFPYRAELYRYPLSGAGEATKVAAVSGRFVSVSINTDETYALIASYLAGSSVEPGNRIDIVDMGTGAVQHIDVKTRPCNFVIADYASWSPGGRSFAFSAAGFSSEGDLWPRELWICNVGSFR